MVGFPGPHCPYDPAPDFSEKFDPDNMPNSIPEVAEDTPLLRQFYIEDNKVGTSALIELLRKH